MTGRVKVMSITVLIAVATLGCFFLMQDFPAGSETVYYNGTVLTMDDSRPQAGAVYVKNGRIAAVGDEDSVMAMKTSSTVLVDLGGKTLMPGFIDPHSHVDMSAYLYDMIDLSGFVHSTNREVWEYLESRVGEYGKGAWILCKGLDPILVPDLEMPDLAYLDRIAPENPLVILTQTLHSYWANTAAFKASGIDSSTPDPSGASYYGRDGQGAFTGLVVEQQAFSPIREAMLKATPAKRMLGNFNDTMKEYARKGNTTVVSAGLASDKKILLRLQEHLSSGKPEFLNQILTLAGVFPKRSALPRHFLYMRHEMKNLMPARLENGDDFFRIIGIKIWYDGSPYTGSMYLEEPYLDSNLSRGELHIKPGHRGESLMDKDRLEDLIDTYSRKKWQISIHAQGDKANADVLDAFEKVGRRVDIVSLRHRIEHGLLVDKNRFAAMKALNISPSFHVNHIYYYGEALRDSILGVERAEAVLPVKAAVDAGLPFTLHADQPMFESDPFSLIQTAVTRRTRLGSVLGEDQAITVGEALKALTITAAWQIGLEEKLGSITEGKYADLVILDGNPLETPPDRLREIKVLKTIVNGTEVDLVNQHFF